MGHGPFSWLRNDAFIYTIIIIIIIIIRNDAFIYNVIINCRQYCFGLLGLISALLMSVMKVSHKSHLKCPTLVVTSQSCQSAQTREVVSVRNC